MSVVEFGAVGQEDAMAIQQEQEVSYLAAEIEKSIRVAQRLKLDLVVYLLLMAKLEVASVTAED